MTEDSHDRGAMTTYQFDRLTRDIQQHNDSSPEMILKQICSGLKDMEPVRAAGLFCLEDSSSTLQWIFLDPSNATSMHGALVQGREGLINMLLTKDSQIQQDLPDGGQFVATPAGTYDGAPMGLAVSTERKLYDDELSHLKSFGILAALIAENARLHGLISEDNEAGSTARMLGFIAHELRTPLTGMRGNIQLALMANRKGQNERIPNRLEAAIIGVDNMTGLVQKLLDVSRLERGSFPLTLANGKIGDTINQAVNSFLDQPDISLASIQITGDTKTTLEHDSQAMQETLCFLFESITPHLAEESTPELTVTDDGVLVRIHIAYAGSGFSDDDLAALSAPLSSTRSSSERNEHLSLDLAYCRGVIRRHNGQIVLHTDTPTPDRQAIDILLPH